jgi:hypothetical protein
MYEIFKKIWRDLVWSKAIAAASAAKERFNTIFD